MKTHCKKGHLLKDNFRRRLNHGIMCTECLTCIREGQKRRVEKYKSLDPQYSRKKHLKNRYNLTQDDFNKLFLSQDNKCAICLSSSSEGKGFVVDHDHINKNIRGILCNNCNAGIGYLLDNEEILSNAIKYLRKSRQ